jgi:flavorubredoxin
MFYREFAKDVYSVGVLNPNMRVFDIVMKTDFGTSYNSYLVKGSEKTALIEAVHKDYLDYFLSNIKQTAEIDKIDYLIMNHNEPDHSGAIEKLLDVMPDLTIIASQAGALYLKNITNKPNLNVKVVKDGETLDLGGKTLTFINAPFLHWPDSMFTYLKEDKVLFSCDYLGSHYCEPQMIDTEVTYPESYESAFLGYYTAIFGPFKPYVLKGYEKIKDLDLEFIAPSHGPVLTKGCQLEKAIEKYIQWSTPVQRDHKLIPLFYCSAYGNTKKLAQEIAAGILEVLPDAEVPVYNIIDHDMEVLGGVLNDSDAFLIGSPTLNRDAVPPVYVLLAHADAVNIAKRPVGVFGSYGWSGEAAANIKARLASLKTKVFEEDCRVIFVPSQDDLGKAREYGKAFAASL